MVRLTILSGPLTGQKVSLKPGVSLVGRGEDCAVRLPDPSVSGQHCEIHASDLGVHLRDLGSTNGTKVAGKTAERMEVLDGQEVEFGSVRVRFAIPRVEITIPELRSTDDPVPQVLANGAPACINHATEPAAFHCAVCQRSYCGACIHDVHLAGRSSRYLCPHCSVECAALTPPAPPAQSGLIAVLQRKGGVFDTIRLAFSRRPKRKR